jgi:hypothetical protein
VGFAHETCDLYLLATLLVAHSSYHCKRGSHSKDNAHLRATGQSNVRRRIHMGDHLGLGGAIDCVEKMMVQIDINSASVEIGIDRCVLKVLSVHERLCRLESEFARFDTV